MITDQQAQALIESTLLNDPRLSEHAIGVAVEGGRVTLGGAVQSFRRKLLAEQIAASFEGVHSVRNELDVIPPEPASDEEIADDVRAALNASADVTKETVQVAVTGGKVTLQGTVGSVWEQAVADDLVRGVRGVRDVANLLVINVEIKVGDEELANAIKAAIRGTRGLAEADLGVAVTRNLITLSGQLRHLWQREMAESVVHRFGLLHVQNEIEVTG